MYGATLGNHRYNFSNLATLLAKASPLRSGDILAGVAAQSGEERVAAQFALADLPLCALLEDHLISYESDEITRLIVDMHDDRQRLVVGGTCLREHHLAPLKLDDKRNCASEQRAHGDGASVQAATRVNAEQASKRTMRRPTRRTAG
jgi:ethanolamine ammonia-lyase large subunit